MITAPSSPDPIKLYLSDLVPPLSSAPAPESLVGQEWTQRMVLIYWWVSLALPWVPGCPFVSLAPCKWRGVSPPTPSCYLGMSFAEARGESSLSPPYHSISPELSFVHRVNQLLLSSPLAGLGGHPWPMFLFYWLLPQPFRVSILSLESWLPSLPPSLAPSSHRECLCLPQPPNGGCPQPPNGGCPVVCKVRAVAMRWHETGAFAPVSVQPWHCCP